MAVAEAGAELAIAQLATGRGLERDSGRGAASHLLTTGAAVVPGWDALDPLALTTGFQRESDPGRLGR